MRKDTDIAQLFRRICQDQCVHSYEALFSVLSPKLIHFSAAILGSFVQAEEIVSDVFIMVWQKRHQLTHITRPLPYLYTCTRNRSLNALSQKKNFISFDELDTDALAVVPAVEHHLVSREVQLALEKAISELPPRCQLIFRLIRMDGLSYNEVAELLHISSKTVDAQLAVALKKLSLAIKLNMSAEIAHCYLAEKNC